jgi:hypothetical protein
VTEVDRRCSGDGHPALSCSVQGSLFRHDTVAIEASFGKWFPCLDDGYRAFTDPSYLARSWYDGSMIGELRHQPGRREWTARRFAGRWREPPGDAQLAGDRIAADWLAASGIPVIEGVDTRKLTRHLREVGAMRGVIAPGVAPTDAIRDALLASPGMEGQDLASLAGVDVPYTEGESGPHVVAWDFGMKRNIVRMFAGAGCRITVVPPRTTAEEIGRSSRTGSFLSNGPGDPAAVGT